MVEMNEVIETNPLSRGLRLQRTADPCVAVIFGASGDLTKRKLIPALYSLFRQNLLGIGFTVVGAARTQMSHDEFREQMRKAVEEFGEVDSHHAVDWQNFAAGLFYHPTDVENPASFAQLKEFLLQMDRDRGTSGNRLLYLSTPPTYYLNVIHALAANGLNRSPIEGSWTRVIIEKPFGRDLESARALNREVLAVFSEDQVYRIDHYLGKETVQNIIVLRFANGILQPLWNQRYIDHVQITSAESIGVENRGGYYETAGALRDMIQNHMIQLVTMVGMEPPVALDADSVRDEKWKVLRAMRPIPGDAVDQYTVRGQYGAGSVGGKPVPGYRQEKGVDTASTTETFAAIKLYIDNFRWAGVPFYVRSGKRLPKRVTEIAIQFKSVPHLLFSENDGGRLDPNSLIIRIQPDEGISLKFGAKLPGQRVQVRPVSMDFQYGTSFGKRSPEAYERLLLDAMLGDATLYARGDMVELSWRFVSPILEAWSKPAKDFPNYAAGTWGPDAADRLIEQDSRRWRRP